MKINNSQFDRAVSSLDVRRSRFPRPSKHLTTFNEGELVPIFVDEVLPGDTFKMQTNCLLRMSTLLTPIMDDLFLDIYYFFIPNRLVWKHWEEFMGENKTGPWIPTTEYSVPLLKTTENAFKKGSIADHMGLPINVKGLSVNSLYFKAYAKIVDDWFISENLQNHPNLSDDDADLYTYSDEQYADLGDDYFIESCLRGGPCFKVNRYRDYFSAALPSPQKGPDVPLPLGSFAPVNTSTDINNFDNVLKVRYDKNISGVGNLHNVLSKVDVGGANNAASILVDSNNYSGIGPGEMHVSGSNLVADLSLATGASVNQLRLAFQVQKFYELMARGGSRYTEIIKSCFGVTSPDARLQRSEFLGGDRCLINIQQVVQTSASQDGSTPKGSVSAYSLTFSHNASFVKSFTEHGIIIGVACVRHKHSYQQGINKMFSRTKKFDYYFPQFANIGEQPILNKELYAQGNDVDEQVFGYQEAFADYRYKPNTISGEFRSTYATPLDSYHLGDNYNQLPILSNSWLQENKNSLDRCLAVKSNVSDQFLADFNFNCSTTRVMPLVSVPGLIDHH